MSYLMQPSRNIFSLHLKNFIIILLFFFSFKKKYYFNIFKNYKIKPTVHFKANIMRILEQLLYLSS